MESMKLEVIGGFLRGARKGRKLKPEQVSLRMGRVLGEGVSQSTVYKVERGEINMGLENFLALLYVLNLDPRALIEIAPSCDDPDEAERIGRMAVEKGGDVAWLHVLTPEARERARQLLDEHPD